MTKLLSSLIVVAVGAFSFNAFAASHAGGAPMKADHKASAPAAKASAAKKEEAKKEMKKEEAKK